MKLYKDLAVIVVIPKNPFPTELFAAEELVKYLKQSIGIDATVVNEVTENAYPFVLGCPSRNGAACSFISSEEFTEKIPGPEGMYISICNHGTLIAGSNDNDSRNRGLLFAVYEYLERYLNCCFGAFTKPGTIGGEVVPVYNELFLENTVYTKAKADLTCRSAHVQYNNWAYDAEHSLNVPFFDYLIKNRFNSFSTWTGVYDQIKEMGLLPELEKRGFNLIVGGHHAIETWLPPFGNKDISIRYVEEHPTYFRLEEDGTRWHPTESGRFGGQLVWCCSNEEGIEEIAKNIIHWVDKNPLVKNISFSPNDFRAPQCCCEECSKHNKMENYLSFANKLIRRVRKVHPGVTIGVCSYTDLWDCPDNMSMEDGLSLKQTVWASAANGGLRACGNAEGRGIIGTKIADNMLKFRKLTNSVTVYEYYMGNYGNRHRLLPAADEMQPIYKFYVENGISGSSTQIECFNIWNNLLNFYCFGRTAYDTDLSLEDQIQNIGKLFGKGASYVAEIFRIYEDTNKGDLPLNKASQQLRETIDANKVYDLFDKALDAAIDDGAAANNIRLLRMAFRYTMLDREEVSVGDPECDELIYMSRNFNSYLTKGGYGIALPVNYFLNDKTLYDYRDPEGSVPDLSKTDKWYMFT